MKIDVLADADSVVRAAASMIAEKARSDVAARGCFIMAVSGGRSAASRRT
jgi:6-phosphogluconolactonase